MKYTLDLFSPLLNAAFTLRDESGVECEAVLVEAAAAGPGNRGESADVPFALLFRVALDAIPAEAARQAMFQVSQPSLETLDLFLVPVNADADGVYFEAVFN
jgi:hypothetical protein